ncbi:hypothetical protein A1O7_06103 [Cladophialophora yegresii CBS 114405]|uniref:Uncharacterized protein n=1 Tax=Cladophialophora yegresii CBS 114405 TaxID=1182544 RepID=W9W125_9EURO|nr:uncharacterized protein A1O7_06103 [Cladophialophora yegresii CBS 114405]EXJ58675.1 hypothetical protein A1O7_06103 [Cladophialophora yegresii CBS 114405]
MDGDHTGKNLDAGANAATKAQDLTEGIHEGTAQKAGAGDKTTGQGTSMFSKDGAIGSQFTGAGAIGGAGNKVGGPIAEDGMIGKHFTPSGAIGGSIQKMAEKNEQH